MKIAYIKSAKGIRTLSQKQELLNSAYLKDIKSVYAKNKSKLAEAGITEAEFISSMKRKVSFI